jgi:hypothetical protein
MSLSLVDSCSCIQKLNIELKTQISNFLRFLQFVHEVN